MILTFSFSVLVVQPFDIFERGLARGKGDDVLETVLLRYEGILLADGSLVLVAVAALEPLGSGIEVAPIRPRAAVERLHIILPACDEALHYESSCLIRVGEKPFPDVFHNI